MNNEKIIDVEIEEKLYSSDEVSAMTGIRLDKIMFYSEKLGDILKISKIGIYQVFDSIDIANINKVKSLEEKGMSMNEIRKYLIANKDEVLMLENKVEKTEKDFLDFLVDIFCKQNQKMEEVVTTNRELVKAHNASMETNNNLINIIGRLIDTQALLPLNDNSDILEVMSDDIKRKLDNIKDDIERNLEVAIKEQNEEIKNDVKHIRETLQVAYVSEQEIKKNSVGNKNGKLEKIINWLKK